MQDAGARVLAVVREALTARHVRRLLQSSGERKRRGHAQDGGGSSCQSDRSCIQQLSFMISYFFFLPVLVVIIHVWFFGYILLGRRSIDEDQWFCVCIASRSIFRI